MGAVEAVPCEAELAGDLETAGEALSERDARGEGDSELDPEGLLEWRTEGEGFDDTDGERVAALLGEALLQREAGYVTVPEAAADALRLRLEEKDGLGDTVPLRVGTSTVALALDKRVRDVRAEAVRVPPRGLSVGKGASPCKFPEVAVAGYVTVPVGKGERLADGVDVSEREARLLAVKEPELEPERDGRSKEARAEADTVPRTT